MNTNTQISMISLFVDEVNDLRESVTFQKEEHVSDQKCLANLSAQENQPIALTSPLKQDFNKKNFNKFNPNPDWKVFFTPEEKKFLSYLLLIQPEKGMPIEEKHATWWIKNFGTEKIKTALQVYWQQVEKAKKNSKIPMPESMSAYIRAALNKGTQPCREADRSNKAFAEQFKKLVGWSGLTITEKYCRAEEISKEWHYNLPEAVFAESLKISFENYCDYTERQSGVA